MSSLRRWYTDRNLALKPVEPASVSRATGETTAEDVAVADLMLDSSERPARSPQTGSKPSGQGDRDESGRPPHHDALSNMSASEENDEQPRHERTEQSAEQSAASPAKVRKPRGVYTNERDEGMLRPSSDCDSEEEYPVDEDGESLETQDDERKRLARLGRKKKNENRQSGAYIPVKPRTNRWESDTYFNKEKAKEMYRPFDGCPSDQEQPLYSEDDNAYDKEKRLAWRVQSLHDETDEEDLRKSRRKSPTPAARKDERAVPGFRDETKHPSQRLPEQSTRRENKQLGENSGDTSSASVKPASGVPASGASLRDGVTTETPDEDGDEFRGRRRRLSSDEEEHVDATSDDDGDKTCTRRRRLSSDTENVDERSDYDGDKMYRPPRWSWGDAEEDADSQDETMEDYGERLHRQDERSEKERRAGEDQTARRENSPSSKDQKTPPSGGENILSSDDMRPDDNKLGGRDRSAVTKDQHGERQANDSRAPSKAGRKETKKSARQDGAWPEDDLDLGGRPVSFDFAQDDEGKTRPIDEARSASQRKRTSLSLLSSR